MKYHTEKLTNIYQLLKTDPDRGLKDGQIIEIQKEKGFNTFDEEKKETVIQKIHHHLKDLTSLILLTAAAISTFLSITEGHGFAEPIVILAIIIIDTILAIYQEMGAEKALEALKNMNAHMTLVIRSGNKQTIDATGLVPGDILVLEAGDMIPADARIIECINLKVEESVLTGESVPVEKDAKAEIDEKAQLGDQANMLFSGCLITSGRAKAVVAQTGMNTEMGKIAGLLINTRQVKTPLQKRMVQFAKLLTVIAVVSAAFLFIIELFRGEEILIILLNAVALAVAAVPETLYVIATITLAYGVQKMAKKNAIIRRIPAVETLGNASVICSDKTGTLTMNRMAIKKVWAVGHEPLDAQDEFGHAEKALLGMMGLASNASIEIKDGEEKEIGGPTETAIIRLLLEKGVSKAELEKTYKRVLEIPFNSERKMLTVVYEDPRGGYLVLTSGAFDRIPFAETDKTKEDKRNEIHDAFARNALRILSLGSKHIDELPDASSLPDLENNFDFEGIVGMIDPPRPESVAAIKTAKEAGIKTVMITGDHVLTASAIAREIGILSAGDKVLTGTELDEMSQEDLTQNVRDYSVYARVSPEDKIRIVQAWQVHGEVVAMTGDGVNDAPALKAADVGISMGSGTDVSKNASDIVLTDDNFASIVDAVAEGRRVYDNIRKALFSLLSDNFAEIIVILFAIIVGWGMPLVAIQLLFINVIADGVPDMFFCREPAEDDIMRRKPVLKNVSLFADGLGKRTGMMTVVLAVVTLIGFYIGSFVTISGVTVASPAAGQTMAFVINAWSSVINSFNIRSYKKSLFTIGFATNRWLSYGIFLSIGLTAVVAALPFLAGIFHCVPLSWGHWLIMIVLSIVPLIVGEIHKVFLRAGVRDN